jgi:uncharacterized repeat protein (TIGR01451 family)
LGERIAEIRRGSFGRRLPALVGALLIALFAATTYLASAHPITVDGASTDWLNRAPVAVNTGLIARNVTEQGEYVWSDAQADERTVLSDGVPDTRVDLREVRATATPSDLNLLVRMTALPVASGPGAPQVQFALDYDHVAGSGAVDFVGAETSVANGARWERLLQTRLGSGSSQVAVWTPGAGSPVLAGSLAVSGSTIELSVPWSAIGLSGPPPSIQATIASFRSSGTDDPAETPGADALDAVTDYGNPGSASTTAAETGDGVVDYSARIHFTAVGEVEAPLLVSRYSANLASATAEWIEVANATSETLNIAGFKLGDEPTPDGPEGSYTFPAGTTLGPGSRYIVAQSGAAYHAAFATPPNAELTNDSPAPDMVKFTPWAAGDTVLGDAGDELVVLDGSNTTVDVVPYGTGAYTGVIGRPAPSPGETDRRSTALRDTDNATNDFTSTDCAGSKTFDGGPTGTGTQWDTAANWSGDTLPVATDQVCIPSLPIAGVVFDSGTVSVASVTSDESFTMAGGTLNLTSAGQPSTFANLTFSGGTLGGNAQLDVNGLFTWSSGTMAGTGTTNANGGSTFSGTGTKTLNRTFAANSNSTWTAGQFNFSTPASFVNRPGSTFDIQGDLTMTWCCGSDPMPTLVNQGLVRKSTGAGAAQIQVGLQNDGTVSVESGRIRVNQFSRPASSTGTFTVPTGSALEFEGGTVNLEPGSNLTGAGLVQVSGATVNFNGSYQHTGAFAISSGTANVPVPLQVSSLLVAGGTLNLSAAAADVTTQAMSQTAGTLTGPGDVTVTGVTTWSGGTMGGAGTTNANGGLLLNGTTKTLNRTLVNNGAATWTAGQFNFSTPASLVNPAGRTFDIQGDFLMQWCCGSDPIPTFVNAGSVTKSAGTGTADIQVGFPNDGTFTVSSGGAAFYQHSRSFTSTGTFTTGSAANSLEFQSGTYELAAGSTLGGPGTVRVTGATVNAGGTYNAATTAVTSGALNLNTVTTLPAVNLSGGTLGGSANQTVTDLNWTGGTLAGSASAIKTTVTGSLRLSGTTKTLSRRTLDDNVPLASPTQWDSGTLNMNSDAIFNLAGRIDAVGDMDWGGDAGQTVNVRPGGVFTKSGQNSVTESTAIENTFNNDGTVLVPTGLLRLQSNGSHSGPFTIGTGGALQFEGGNQTSGGAITGSGPLPAPANLTAGSTITGGALPAGTYFYKVTAFNINGETVGSAQASTTIDSGTTGRVTLGWDAVAGATSYRVYRGTTSNGQSVFYSTSTPGFVDTGTPPTAGAVPDVNTTAARAYFSGGSINLSGSYSVPTTWVGGGTANFNGPTVFQDLHVFGGTGAVNTNANAAFLSLTGGALGGSGQVTLVGPRASSWTGGTMSGSGTTLVPSGVTVNLSGTNVKDFHTGRVWRNEGSVVWAGGGGIRTGTGAVFQNVGVFDVQTDANFGQDFGGTAQILNTGTFRKTVGPGGAADPTDVGVPFENDGTVIAQVGRLSLNNGDGPGSSTGSFQVPAQLEFSGGTHELAAGSSVTGAGTVFFTSGQVNVNGTYDLATTAITGGTHVFDAPDSLTDVLSLSGGILTGGGRVTLQGPAASSWTGGTMSGSGTTLVPTGVTFNLSGASVKDFHTGRVWRNEGSVVWTGSGGIRTGTGATFQNTALFDIQTDANFGQDFGGTAQILNTGTFRKTVGPGGAADPTDVGAPFENDGTVLVQAGRLSLNNGDGPGSSSGVFQVPAQLEFGGGTHELAAASNISGAGTIFLTSGQINVGGVYDLASTTISGGTASFDVLGPVTDVLTFSGGTLTGPGRLTMEGPGPSTWTGGTMSGAGTTRVGSGATLNVSGTSVKDIHTNRVLRNEGSVVWTGTGPIRTGQGMLLDNVGLFDVQTDAALNQDFGGPSTFSNTGTFRKSVATGTTTANLTFTNDANGTIDVRTGTFDPTGLTNYNNTTKTLTGGTYLLQGTLQLLNGDIQTNAAKIVLEGPTSRIIDRATTPADALRNFSTNGAAGDFSIVGGRNLFSAAARGPNLANNGTLRGTGTYFQNVTNNGHVAAGASPGILTVDGNYTQGPAGTLDVEVAKLVGAVAGTDYDRLAVTGTATLGGTVNAIPLAGFVPSTGTGIDVVTAGARSGVFANVISTPSPLGGNLVPEARYDPTTAKLFVVPGGGAADDSVPEAAGTKTVTVTLSAPSSETATLNYATADDTAKAGEDYSARSGTLTFAPNDTSETFDVPITNDARDETDQSFLVNLSNPVNTVLTDTQASVSILDDDAPPTLAIGDVIKAEGSGGTTPFNLEVTLTAPSENQVTVSFATVEDTATQISDFTAATDAVSFAPLETSKTVTIQVQGDTNIENDERFFVDLSAPTNATLGKARGIATIVDDDLGGAAPQVSIADATAVAEGDAGVQDVTFQLVATPTPTGPVSVAYGTASGTATSGEDFNAAAGTATLVNGVADITVQVRGDNLDEATENFTVNLAGPSGATLGDAQGVATITDDDAAPVLNTEPMLVLDEDDPDAPVDFTLQADDGDDDPLTFQITSGPNHGTLTGPTGAVVHYRPDPNFNGFDVFSVRVTDGANSATGSYQVQVSAVNDAPVAADVTRSLAEDTSETIVLPAADIEGQPLTYAVSNLVNGSVVLSGNEATFTPAPNYSGPASFQFRATDSSLAQSNLATASLTVTAVNDAPSANDAAATTNEDAATTITLTSSDVEGSASTYSLVSPANHGTLSAIAGGQITYTPDRDYHGGDSFRFRANDGALDSAPATVSITVTPVNDAPVAQGGTASTVQNTAVDIGLHATDVDGDELAFAVVGGGPAHGTVTIDGANAHYVPTTGYTGPDSFQFVADDDQAQSAPATVNITVVPAGGGGGAVTANIANVTTSEANDELLFTLALTGVAPGAQIRLRTTDDTARAGEDYFAMTTTFTFNGGETSHDFIVKLKNDAVDEDDERFRVVMESVAGGVVLGTPGVGTISDDDAAPSLSATSFPTDEGDTASHVVAVPVALTAPSGKTVTVGYATSDGSATQPVDYAAAAGTLTFAPGDVVKLALVTINGDTDVEPNETVSFGLSSPVNAAVAGGGTITIVNDDSLTPPQPPPPPPPPPPAIPTADLALTMEGPTTSTVDRNVTYTLGVRNNGPSTASAIVISDSLAEGMQLVSAAVGSVTCAGSQTVTCPVGVLPSGGVATATVIASITEAGSHTNTASVSGAQADPNAANNSASVTTRVPLPVERTPQQQNKGCTLAGTPGVDVLRGTPGRDVICGYGGNDVLIGFGGDDRLLGGTGNDRILGGPGKDVLKGGNGKDELLGGPGADQLDGGRGPDTLYGERGNDVLLGSFGNDFLAGGPGRDRVLGGPGKDRMRREKADAALLGGPGKDQCLTTGVLSFCP